MPLTTESQLAGFKSKANAISQAEICSAEMRSRSFLLEHEHRQRLDYRGPADQV